MPAYDTLSEALSDLKKRGYITDFNLVFDKVKCTATGKCLSPAEFEITAHYRFEGESNPSDEAVIYTIESKDGIMKGTLVSAYGMYSEKINEEMIRKLSVHHA
ncbi:MAG: phosphoribosylpyrophosphate synthetase [Parafilimonas sp.]